jgi:hypothetical protein
MFFFFFGWESGLLNYKNEHARLRWRDKARKMDSEGLDFSTLVYPYEDFGRMNKYEQPKVM